MSFEYSSESSLSFPYSLFVEPGSHLELDFLFEGSENLDLLLGPDSTDSRLDYLREGEYVGRL